MARHNTGKSTTGGQYSFAQVPTANIQRSVFNRSCGHKTTMGFGTLYPVYVDEVLPGDTFMVDMAHFVRLQTQLNPVLENMYLDAQWWFVPTRLLWENWERFNGARDNPDDDNDFVTPKVTCPASTGFDAGSLFDYMGLPPGIEYDTDTKILAFYSRAYNLIWNEWYRDQNLQDSVVVDIDNGPDDPDDYVLLPRGKRHDYFTSCLPWPQKGPSVQTPLGSTAPVTIDTVDTTGAINFLSTGGAPIVNLVGGAASPTWSATPPAGNMQLTSPTGWVLSGEANLENATAATINQLRQAFQIQRLYERDARGGTRYVELLKSHFQVTSPDFRLQRPEFLGGSSTPFNINPVASTTSTWAGISVVANMGSLGAYSTNSGSNRGFRKSFTEHGVILCLVSARADLNYQEGINKHFTRDTRWDYFWPALAHLGEQAVLSSEIYVDGTSNDQDVFGYQERYAEYRYKPSYVTAQMRSSATQSFDVYHLAQYFDSSRPVLNDSFIQENPPIDRILFFAADIETPAMFADFFFSVKTARPMPTYSVPGLIDHF